jgi:hypothetical protein
MIVLLDGDRVLNLDEVDFMETDRHSREGVDEVETHIQFRAGHYMIVKGQSAEDIWDRITGRVRESEALQAEAEEAEREQFLRRPPYSPPRRY